MTKTKKTKPQKQVITELAAHFEQELNKTLPITVHKNGAVTYKGYAVMKNPLGNWGLYNMHSKDCIEQFYLRTSAIMAAKAHDQTRLERMFEIKHLDNRYWANFCDSQTYKHNIKTAKDFDRYLVLLNKLENTQQLTDYYREEIAKMFKWSFV